MINITLSRYLGDKRIKQSELSRISNVNKNKCGNIFLPFSVYITMKQKELI